MKFLELCGEARCFQEPPSLHDPSGRQRLASSEKMMLMNLFAGRKGDTDIEKGLVDIGGGSE